MEEIPLALCYPSRAEFAAGWLRYQPTLILIPFVAIYSFAAMGDSAVLSAALTESVDRRNLGTAVAGRSILGFGAGGLSPYAFGAVLGTLGNAGSRNEWGQSFAVLGFGGIIATICALLLPGGQAAIAAPQPEVCFMTYDYTCRPSTNNDMHSIARIYAHYVGTTSTSFEIDVPSTEEMARRRVAILDQGLPHLVAVIDRAVVGYAYASPYRSRPAYRFTIEDSIYIDPSWIRRGLGRLLLSALIRNCEDVGRRQMIAVIGDPINNAASIGLHTAFGFEHVGILHAVGHKFDRWVDTVIMQRSLGATDLSQPL